MSHEVNIHAAQTSILRELLFLPQAGFADLQKPTGLTSDHFTFHINRLMELGFVDRTSRGQYRLSTKGKEFANRLDTDNNTVERQPKAAVLLAIERANADGEREFLFQERLKQPYFGFWGLPSGKLRWGETIVEGAARELMEETGFTADYRIAGLYHEHVKLENEIEIKEDKLFFVVHCTNYRGELIERFEGGHNQWMTREEALSQPKVFGSFHIELDIVDDDNNFIEKLEIYPTESF